MRGALGTMESGLSDGQWIGICVLLHMVLEHIRVLFCEGASEQAADFADATRQLPLVMFSPDFMWEHVLDAFASYVKRYASSA
jgi:hypothetical protein